MFVWVHALGTGAMMLPEECRRPALVMLASFQTMILAAQGSRSYSVREWTRSYVDQAKEFFGSIEALMYYTQEHRDDAPFRPLMRYRQTVLARITVCVCEYMHSYTYTHTRTIHTIGATLVIPFQRLIPTATVDQPPD